MSYKMFNIQRRHIMSMDDACASLLGEKSIKLDIAKIYTRNRIAVRDIIDEVQSQQKLFQAKRTELQLEHCQKEKDSDAPLMNGRDYIGLEPGINPEFDEGIKELTAEMEVYIKDVIGVELTTIPDVKLKNSGNQLEGIFFLLDSEQVEDVEVETEDGD